MLCVNVNDLPFVLHNGVPYERLETFGTTMRTRFFCLVRTRCRCQGRNFGFFGNGLVAPHSCLSSNAVFAPTDAGVRKLRRRLKAGDRDLLRLRLINMTNAEPSIYPSLFFIRFIYLARKCGYLERRQYLPI